jgi:hypothetical protein
MLIAGLMIGTTSAGYCTSAPKTEISKEQVVVEMAKIDAKVESLTVETAVAPATFVVKAEVNVIMEKEATAESLESWQLRSYNSTANLLPDIRRLICSRAIVTINYKHSDSYATSKRVFNIRKNFENLRC